MNKQEKLAREWAALAKHFEVSSREQQAAAEYILAHTTPETMADVAWDDMEHRGMVGVGEDGVEWVMLYLRADGRIIGVTPDFGEARGLLPKWLTPTGKRYELREVTVSSGENVGADQPGHPEVLRTVEDYENAPLGTIGAKDTFAPWVKTSAYFWTSAYGVVGNIGMAAKPGTFRVLRWGEQA